MKQVGSPKGELICIKSIFVGFEGQQGVLAWSTLKFVWLCFLSVELFEGACVCKTVAQALLDNVRRFRSKDSGACF
jgi:hypothetical protein